MGEAWLDNPINPRDVPIPQEIRDKWQNIVNILVRIMKVPAALIMRVNFPVFTVFQSGGTEENPFRAGQEFKLPAGIYCEKTMRTKEKQLVPNALKDPEWDKNPSIPAGMISYLGFPIFYPDNDVFGTLCILDNKENSYSSDFEEVMSQFKEIIESHLKLLWQKMTLEELLKRQKIAEEEAIDKAKEIARFNNLCVDRELRIIELKEKIARLENALNSFQRGGHQ